MLQKQKSRKKEEDGLYLNEEDREQLQLLTEAEREEILYERHIRKTEENERKELKHRRRGFGEESETESESKDVFGYSERAIPKMEYKTSFDLFKNIVLRRDTLLKIVYKRAIDRLKGYYVKIRLAEGYCLYKILRVYESKRYEVGGVVTNKWLSLGRNKDRKEVNMQSISNAPVTREEYGKYARENLIEGGDKEIMRLYKRISRDLESDATEEEMNYSLAQKKRFLQYGKIAVKRRIELKVMLERAKAEDRKADAEEIERELQEIEDASCE